MKTELLNEVFINILGEKPFIVLSRPSLPLDLILRLASCVLASEFQYFFPFAGVFFNSTRSILFPFWKIHIIIWCEGFDVTGVEFFANVAKVCWIREVLMLRFETYTRWGYAHALLARNAYSCLLDWSTIMLALCSRSGRPQWDWGKQVYGVRNSTSCMIIYRCDSIIFHILLFMYRYCLLFMELSLSLLHHVSQPV